jgi:hypothetical protein
MVSDKGMGGSNEGSDKAEGQEQQYEGSTVASCSSTHYLTTIKLLSICKPALRVKRA